jgi:hypothetical protein
MWRTPEDHGCSRAILPGSDRDAKGLDHVDDTHQATRARHHMGGLPSIAGRAALGMVGGAHCGVVHGAVGLVADRLGFRDPCGSRRGNER